MAATRRAADVHAALCAKGMEPHEGHHHMLIKKLDGVATVVTRISHGARDINTSLASRMAKQCYLQLAEFWDLVDCPLTEDQWNDLIAQRTVDGRNPFIGR